MGSESSSSRIKHDVNVTEVCPSDNEVNQFISPTAEDGCDSQSIYSDSDRRSETTPVVYTPSPVTNHQMSTDIMTSYVDTNIDCDKDSVSVTLSDSCDLEKLSDQLNQLSTSSDVDKVKGECVSSIDRPCLTNDPVVPLTTTNETTLLEEKLEHCELILSDSENGVSPALFDSIHHVKWISFNGGYRPIVTQNENGPCPMIAIINVLLLRGAINLPKDTAVISGDQILTILSDHLLSVTPKNLDKESLLNYESTVYDAFSLFPSLQTGLDVNVRFTGISHFEYTTALSIFDLFNICIYHGWLVDPEEQELASVIASRTYNQMVEELVRLRTSSNQDDAYKCLLVECFFEQSASQLTFHGLSQLCSTLRDQQLAVFFRNNHFSTILKRSNSVLVLVTDLGLVDEPNIVWEVLNDIDGDTQFVDSSFRLYCPAPTQRSSTETGFSKQPINNANENSDLASKLDRQQSSYTANM